MLNQPTVRRVAVPAMLIAIGNLVSLALLIGWVGASRSFAVGPHTIYRDHLAAVVAVLLVTAVVAGLVGRRLNSVREVLLTVGVLIAADVVAALFVTLLIDEMRRHPELVRAVLAETAGGMQIVAVALGAAVGYGSKRLRRNPPLDS